MRNRRASTVLGVMNGSPTDSRGAAAWLRIMGHRSAARSSCPAAASACADLSDHLTWLQSGARITCGPVPLEPWPPGTQHATPRGTFHGP
jgi:hypothetical protein